MADMGDEWFTLDAMIFGALAAYPRQSFVLHIYMPSLPKPAGKECVRCFLPRCSALRVLDFVYYDEVVLRNQTRTTGHPLSASIFPQSAV